jgi:HEPN domain-containing protein
MSQSENQHTARRWLTAARDDLKAAQALSDAHLYAHACFTAQQCAEKAIKALWYLVGEIPWGHSVQKLTMEFAEREQVSELAAWVHKAALLDRFYVPTRYPNGLPDLTPEESFFEIDAQQGIMLATELLAICQRWLENFSHDQTLGHD